MINEYIIEGKRDEDADMLFGDYTQDNKDEQSPLKKFENEVYKKFTTKEYEIEIVNYLKKTIMEGTKDKKKEKTSDLDNNEVNKLNNNYYNEINKEMAFMKKVALDKKFSFRNDGLYAQYNKIFLNEKTDK